MNLIDKVNTAAELEQLAIAYASSAWNEPSVLTEFLSPTHTKIIGTAGLGEFNYVVWRVHDESRKRAFITPEVTVAESAFEDDWDKVLLIVGIATPGGDNLLAGMLFVESSAVGDYVECLQMCADRIRADVDNHSKLFNFTHCAWVAELNGRIGEHAEWTICKAQGMYLDANLQIVGGLALHDGKYCMSSASICFAERNVDLGIKTLRSWLEQFDIVEMLYRSNGSYKTDHEHESAYQKLIDKVVNLDSDFVKGLLDAIAELKNYPDGTGVTRTFTLRVGNILLTIKFHYYSELDINWRKL